jgi:rSAM/selenodomain-associated transferase 2
MISVIIPTLNSEATLGRCLLALLPAAIDGLVQQVVIADGGSSDRTVDLAEEAGADVAVSQPGRGQQIRTGIAEARAPWLLVLHSDTELQSGWEDEVSDFMRSVDLGQRDKAAAAFRYALDDVGFMPRLMETFVHLRSNLAKLPYGDQALLIPRRLHDEIGGYKPMPILEDVEIIRRLGRRRVSILKSGALTSSKRYRSEGYLRRVARNQVCLMMYAWGAPIERIADYYKASSKTSKAASEMSDTAAKSAAHNIKPS